MGIVRLTNRQTQIALLLGRGLSPAEVGEKLKLHRNTVYHYLHHGCRRTGAKTNMQLVAMVAVADFKRKIVQS